MDVCKKIICSGMKTLKVARACLCKLGCYVKGRYRIQMIFYLYSMAIMERHLMFIMISYILGNRGPDF